MTEKLQPDRSTTELQGAAAPAPDSFSLEPIIPDPHQYANDSLGHGYCSPNSGLQEDGLNFSGENPTIEK